MESPRTLGRNDAAGGNHGSVKAAQGPPNTENAQFVDQKAAAGREACVKATQGPPNTENAQFVDQKAAARFGRVREQVLAQPRLFAAQGAVVAAWRVYRGRRLGPYFRLAYREAGRQRSIYLGRCAELVRRVRCLLARLQDPRRQRRAFRRLEAQVRASLRRCKARLKETLARLGIQLKGFEFRGSRRALDGWSSAFRRSAPPKPP